MIPFSPPRIDEQIIEEVVDTLKSGWITTGPKTKLLEKRLLEYCDSKAVLCLGSATAGLELMLRWFGVGDGDEVILPAYTYSATANVVVHCGAKPVFVDVADNFNIDVEAVNSALTEKTKVIMPVDFGGYPCDYDRIMELALGNEARKKFYPATPEQTLLNRVLVLSDAAHSLGAVYKGRKTGVLADATVFSFHAVKNLTTAEGGAIAFNLPAPFVNAELYRQLNIKSLHGQDKDALAKMQKGSWRYDIVEAGYKCNMPDVLASIGLVELKRYDNDTLPKRKHICERYRSIFSRYRWAVLPVQIHEEAGTPETHSSYHIYALRIKDITEAQRDEIIQKIFDREVSVNVHFIPVPMMSFYRKLGYDIACFPNTYKLYSTEISLPVFYDMTDEMTDKVIEAVTESVKEVIG